VGSSYWLCQVNGSLPQLLQLPVLVRWTNGKQEQSLKVTGQMTYKLQMLHQLLGYKKAGSQTAERVSRLIRKRQQRKENKQRSGEEKKKKHFAKTFNFTSPTKSDILLKTVRERKLFFILIKQNFVNKMLYILLTSCLDLTDWI
jgi:hypothetical protein